MYLVVVLEGVGGDAGRVHDHGVAVLPVGDGPRVSLHEALQLHVSPQWRSDQLIGHVHLWRDCMGREERQRVCVAWEGGGGDGWGCECGISERGRGEEYVGDAESECRVSGRGSVCVLQ